MESAGSFAGSSGLGIATRGAAGGGPTLGSSGGALGASGGLCIISFRCAGRCSATPRIASAFYIAPGFDIDLKLFDG